MRMRRSVHPHPLQPVVLLTLALFYFSIVAVQSFVSTGNRRHGSYTTAIHASSSEGDHDVVVVAVTREEGKNGKLQQELAERLGENVKIQELPCIAHADGDDFDQLGPALLAGNWDYVCVTSPEAARVLGTVWKDSTEGKKPPKVAVVGKATQAALESLEIPVDFCPTKALAKILVQELPPKEGESATTTVLYPASQQAATTLQDGLTKRGFSVTRLNTYDTVTATWTDEERTAASKVGVACFGSPSAVQGWCRNTHQSTEVLAACIGETSANACRKAEWPESRIFYPDTPGIPGWADSVEQAVASLQQVAHTKIK